MKLYKNIKELISQKGLQSNCKIIYLILYAHADKDGICQGTIEDLSHLSGLERRATERAIKELKENNLIETSRTESGNIYKLLKIKV